MWWCGGGVEVMCVCQYSWELGVCGRAWGIAIFTVSRACQSVLRPECPTLISTTLGHCAHLGGIVKSPVQFIKASWSWVISLEILLVCSGTLYSNRYRWESPRFLDVVSIFFFWNLVILWVWSVSDWCWLGYCELQSCSFWGLGLFRAGDVWNKGWKMEVEWSSPCLDGGSVTSTAWSNEIWLSLKIMYMYWNSRRESCGRDCTVRVLWGGEEAYEGGPWEDLWPLCCAAAGRLRRRRQTAHPFNHKQRHTCNQSPTCPSRPSPT